MITLLDDLRFGARSLVKRPGFAVVAIATLALGIGVNTAIFSVVDGVLLRPVPFDQSEQLIHVVESSPPEFPSMSVAYPNYLDWRDRNHTFSDLAAHRFVDLNLTDMGTPELLRAAQVSANLFGMLRAEPAFGRTFSAAEDEPGGPKVAVLSDALWHARFAGEPSAIGKTLMLDGEPYEVIGVMPPEFSYPVSSAPPRLWLPIGHFSAEWLEERGDHPGIQATGRRADGASFEQAQKNLVSIAAALAKEYPDTNTGNSVAVAPLQDRLTRRIKPALVVLSGAVLFVMLIACVNVANLLLVRAAGRGPEMAIRSAIGAGRLRLVRQLITESVLLAIIGGLAGVGLAYAVLELMLAHLDLNLPAYSRVTIDGRVLLFALCCASVTGFLFGLAPALHTVGMGLASRLRDGGRATVGTKSRRLRNGLVVAEIALALVLLVGASLFVRSFGELIHAEAGFDVQNVLNVELSLSVQARTTSEEQTAFFAQALERIRALPGVVAASQTLPLLGGWQSGINMEGQPIRKPGEGISTEIFRVDPDLFSVLGIKRHSGRLFTEADRSGATKVAVVDQRFADTIWPGEDPLGRRFLFGRPDEEEIERDGKGGERIIPLAERWIEVVGVVNHVKSYGVDADSMIQAYIPASQDTIAATNLVIRTQGNPYLFRAAVEAEILALDPNQPVGASESLADLVGDNYAATRIAAVLLAAFAVLATLLAALGIYGVMAYTASQRRHEIGIRMALGADRGSVVQLLVRQGMRVAAIGLAIGMVAVFVLSPALQAQLFGVSAREPSILAVVAGLLALVALGACVVPARRASRVHPITALRSE